MEEEVKRLVGGKAVSCKGDTQNTQYTHHSDYTSWASPNIYLNQLSEPCDVAQYSKQKQNTEADNQYENGKWQKKMGQDNLRTRASRSAHLFCFC